VRTLDKQQGSYRQVTSTAVKQDLVISAYKPNGGLEERFKLEAGTEEGVWDFIRTHLRTWVSEGWAYTKQILMFPQGVSEVRRKRRVPTFGRSMDRLPGLG
jgi:hypothetical protein